MKIRLIFSILLLLAIGIIASQCGQQPGNPSANLSANTYTGNESCKGCHAQEHAQWQGSHHYMAMQPANDTNVYGDFNNASFTADGVTSRFYKKDGKFIINTDDEKGQNRDFEVLYIFGFTPLQQYLVAFPGGKMQVPRVSWDTRAKKWFHQYAGDRIPAGDWLHWTGNGQNWNTMCASCHSTNLNKGYDVETDTYHTTYNDINVSCESCHGPGKNHIDYIAGNDYKKGDKIPGSLLKLYKGAGATAEINTCAYCHTRRVDIAGNVTPGAELLDDMIPALPTNDFFFADGQMNDEDYNYTSFAQSKMFQRGVQCGSCHNPHSGKLKLEGSLVCGQCHSTDTYTSEKHTLHKITDNEVNCITCHMPSKMYMGNDLRHDHSFRIPRPDLTAKYGTPNTCNQCHTDKSATWAADKIAANFGNARRYHFAEDLVPGSRLEAGSEPHLQKLLGDSAVPNIVRAAAMQYISQMSTPVAGSTMTSYLRDSSALVRHVALRGLSQYSPGLWAQAASTLLSDPVRAVRIAAADLFLNIPAAQIPPALFDAYSKAKAELERYVIFQTDFAVGNVQAGDYYRKQNELSLAEKYYKRAVAKDSQLAIARINLSSALNATGKNAEALNQLLAAAKLEPNSDHVMYSLGLLYAEMNDPAKASMYLKKATDLNKNNIRAHYNYGLLLQQGGKSSEAEAVFKTGLQAAPTDGDLLNALTILYMQQQQIDKALATGRLLQQYHGNNPRYAGLLRDLRLSN